MRRTRFSSPSKRSQNSELKSIGSEIRLHNGEPSSNDERSRANIGHEPQNALASTFFSIFKPTMGYFWESKPTQLSDLKEKLILPIEEAKKRARIVVIDDDPTAFPVDLLRAEGYNIQQWERLENLRNLEEGQFDIIVLDMYGISSPALSKNDGLGILEHLKSTNPAQIVIAYSGKKFDLRHQNFWTIADDYLGKPTDMLVAKAKLDALLREKFTAERYWNSLVEFLRARNVNEGQLSKLESAVAQAASKKKPLSESDVAGLLRLGKDVIATAWIIVQVIQRLTG
jgi:DNA-binding response OmpR family regulator